MAIVVYFLWLINHYALPLFLFLNNNKTIHFIPESVFEEGSNQSSASSASAL